MVGTDAKKHTEEERQGSLDEGDIMLKMDMWTLPDTEEVWSVALG